jgi:hypothetical protein
MQALALGMRRLSNLWGHSRSIATRATPAHTATVLDGKQCADDILHEVKLAVTMAQGKIGRRPGLGGMSSVNSRRRSCLCPFHWLFCLSVANNITTHTHTHTHDYHSINLHQ